MSASKAAELLAAADKKANTKPGLFGKMFGNPLQQYEDAAELYTSAANQLKMCKQWKEAGAANVRAAEMQIKAEAPHEAASCYTAATTCYKKSDNKSALECMSKTVAIYIDMGRFAVAAKQYMNMGEINENTLADLEAALEAYQQAATLFEGEDSTSSASKANLKVATILAQLGRFAEAFPLYEEMADKMIDNHLLKFGAKEYYLKAGLCRLCAEEGEAVGARRAAEDYVRKFAQFRDSREQKFLMQLIEAVDAQDVDAYTGHVAEYDAVSTLDGWYTQVLLAIKKHLQKEDELL